MTLKEGEFTGGSVGDPARRKTMLDAGKNSRRTVRIKNTKLKLESDVVESSLKVWLDRGWTRVDDKNSDAATRGASKKEKN